jgi:c-di-GMP-binding flagellar brake protein YcgR
MSYMRDRRIGFRVRLEVFVTLYVGDRPLRALTENLSDTGVFLQVVRSPLLEQAAREQTPVAIEIALPGVRETLWAAGVVTHAKGDELVEGTGLRFTALPRAYARMLRDFCVESRRRGLTDLLGRIPGALLPTPA